MRDVRAGVGPALRVVLGGQQDFPAKSCLHESILRDSGCRGGVAGWLSSFVKRPVLSSEAHGQEIARAIGRAPPNSHGADSGPASVRCVDHRAIGARETILRAY